MTGLRRCYCDDPNCQRMECVVCGMSDCKWPGECYGRCRRCGAGTEPNRLGGPMERSDGRGLWMEMYCSKACQDICWAEAEAAGLVINLSDVTPERANELFNTMGLQLEGVGKVVSS